MTTFRNNPDGEENQQATKESASYIGGLKLKLMTPTAEALRAASDLANDGKLVATTEVYAARLIDSATGLPALIAFKEGVIRNAPSCGACAEALFCGSTNAPHTCALAEIAALREALQAAQQHLEYCGYGDKWERECAVESNLEERINSALASHETKA